MEWWSIKTQQCRGFGFLKSTQNRRLFVPWTAPRSSPKTVTVNQSSLRLELFHIHVEKQVNTSPVNMLLEHGKTDSIVIQRADTAVTRHTRITSQEESNYSEEKHSWETWGVFEALLKHLVLCYWPRWRPEHCAIKVPILSFLASCIQLFPGDQAGLHKYKPMGSPAFQTCTPVYKQGIAKGMHNIHIEFHLMKLELCQNESWLI